MWLWCASSVSLPRPWRPQRAALTAGLTSAMSVSSCTTRGGHPGRNTNTSSQRSTSDQRQDFHSLDLHCFHSIMSQCTLNRTLVFFFPLKCALDIDGMLKFVFGLRSWPAQSTTRRNYTSIVDPVSGSSALSASYAASTPDTKSCQWCMHIKPWRCDPWPSSRSGQGSFCRICLKNSWIFIGKVSVSCMQILHYFVCVI